MKRALVLSALAVCGAMVLSSCLPDDSGRRSAAATHASDSSEGALAEEVTPSPTAAPVPVAALQVHPSPTPKPASALLYPAEGGDGDSWKDRQGRKYRMGLINTPEYNECYGSTATAKRKSMTANGFRAQVYSTDKYGRRVSVIFTASGVNLNIYLARHGYANDKYLEEFRSENPSLASKLDVAFAAAKREKAGLWSACGSGSSTTTVAAQSTSCHPDYKTCIPIKGDGSGNGDANDLDCGDLTGPVYLRQIGVDPYRLDNDGDGVGCE